MLSYRGADEIYVIRGQELSAAEICGRCSSISDALDHYRMHGEFKDNLQFDYVDTRNPMEYIAIGRIYAPEAAQVTVAYYPFSRSQDRPNDAFAKAACHSTYCDFAIRLIEDFAANSGMQVFRHSDSAKRDLQKYHRVLEKYFKDDARSAAERKKFFANYIRFIGLHPNHFIESQLFSMKFRQKLYSYSDL